MVLGAVILMSTILTSTSAEAHELQLRVRFAEGKVRIEARYPGDDSPAAHARVRISRMPDPQHESETTEGAESKERKALLASGTTSEEGLFFVTPPRDVGLHVVVEDGMGHYAEVDIPREILAPLLAPGENPTDPGVIRTSEKGGPLGDLPTILAVMIGLVVIGGGTWVLWAFTSDRRRRAP